MVLLQIHWPVYTSIHCKRGERAQKRKSECVVTDEQSLACIKVNKNNSAFNRRREKLMEKNKVRNSLTDEEVKHQQKHFIKQFSILYRKKDHDLQWRGVSENKRGSAWLTRSAFYLVSLATVHFTSKAIKDWIWFWEGFFFSGEETTEQKIKCDT